MSDPDDLFADDYVSARDRRRETLEEIEERLANEDAETTRKRHAKHTRKPRHEGPEAKVQKRIRDHLEKHYRARVLRTNAGFVPSTEGSIIYLGDPGQSDLHAIIPLTIYDVLIGVFMAIECKAGSNKATEAQLTYLEHIKRRGGIGVVAYDVLDIDEAISAKKVELLKQFTGVCCDRD